GFSSSLHQQQVPSPRSNSNNAISLAVHHQSSDSSLTTKHRTGNPIHSPRAQASSCVESNAPGASPPLSTSFPLAPPASLQSPATLPVLDQPPQRPCHSSRGWPSPQTPSLSEQELDQQHPIAAVVPIPAAHPRAYSPLHTPIA